MVTDEILCAVQSMAELFDTQMHEMQEMLFGKCSLISMKTAGMKKLILELSKNGSSITQKIRKTGDYYNDEIFILNNFSPDRYSVRS